MTGGDLTDHPITPVKEEIEALGRIALTRDGVLLHRYLRRVLEAVHDILDDGALRQATGRRTLARDMMKIMAAGIEGSSGRFDGNGDAAILSGNADPIGRRSRYGQRLGGSEPIPGWPSIDNPDGDAA